MAIIFNDFESLYHFSLDEIMWGESGLTVQNSFHGVTSDNIFFNAVAAHDAYHLLLSDEPTLITTITLVFHVLRSGVWKEGLAASVLRSGTWKKVETASVLRSGTWKT